MSDSMCMPIYVEAIVGLVGAGVGAATVWLLQRAHGALSKCKYDFNEFECLPEFGGEYVVLIS